MKMGDNGMNLDEMFGNNRISKGTKRVRKELTKQGSAGSTDSEDISEDSGSNQSWSEDRTDPTSQLLIANMDPNVFNDRDLMVREL